MGLTNVVAANAKRAERDLTRVTGVVHNIAKAAAADRKLIKDQTRAMEADLNKSIVRAIAIGEARAKAVEQRINENLKDQALPPDRAVRGYRPCCGQRVQDRAGEAPEGCRQLPVPQGLRCGLCR